MQQSIISEQSHTEDRKGMLSYGKNDENETKNNQKAER